MKKFIFSIIALLGILMPNNVWAEEIAGSEGTDYNEAYAVLSEDNTILTFYYDDQKEVRGGMSVGPFKESGSQPWYEKRRDIHRVVFDDSFANCTSITSTAYWFYDCSDLAGIFGIDNLKTDNVTDMSSMFYHCLNLIGLDVSNFKTDNVTDMSEMFSYCMGVTNIDVSGFNTTNVNDMSEMFSGCFGLTNLDLSGFSTINVTDMHNMFYYCSGLTSLNLSGFNTINVTDMSSMFDSCSSLTSLDISGFKTDNVTDMSYMFQYCSCLTNLDVSGFNTANVTSMSHMFYGCSELSTIDVSGFNTANVTNMSYMFYGCSELSTIDVSGFNTANVTSMSYMFYGCSELSTIDVSGFNTANVMDMDAMFSGCSSLTSLDMRGFKTDDVREMSEMFSSCSNLTRLDVSDFKTDNVRRMSGMFHGCSSLKSLDVSRFNTENVTSMLNMFSGCSGLTDLDVSGFNTANTTNMAGMFYRCSGLTNLDVSGFKTENVTDMDAMFANCSGLTSLDLSSFNTLKVKFAPEDYWGIQDLFHGCSALTTIYVGDGWTIDSLKESTDVFKDCTALVGGAGTKFDVNHIDYTYAHIDGGPDNPGYFTDIADKGKEKAEVEAYVVLSADSTVQTFYYDDQKEVRNGTNLRPFEREKRVPWVTTVVFDNSFANCSTITSTAGWFAAYSNLTSIIGIENLKTDNVTDMNDMFGGCSSLTSLDVSTFNTENVEDMSYMFSQCDGLKSLDLSNFNAPKVTNLTKMFDECKNLESLNLSGFKTESVTDMYDMFGGCSSLTVLDLSGFNTGHMPYISCAFLGCSKLTTIYVGAGWTTYIKEQEGKYDDPSGGDNVFDECVNLVGGNGTTYDAEHTDYTYARIDKDGEPGYFTLAESSEKKEQVATPTWDFQNEMLVLSTETTDASIYYATANWADEAETDSIANTIDVSTRSTLYQNPIEITDNIIIKMIAAKEGMENSEEATFVYDYKSWRNLYDVIRYGVDVLEKAKDNANVEEGLLEELKWALNEGDMMYQRRAEMSNQEAKYFIDAIVNLCKKIEDQMSSESHQDGDIITEETVEGVWLKYLIISESEKTCQVGTIIPGDDIFGSEDLANATDTSTVGTITIPEEVKGYRVIGIGKYAFQHCEKITNVSLSKYIKYIGESAFGYMRIPSISLSEAESLEKIFGGAFECCNKLTSIIIPSTVTHIGYNPIYDCSSLESVIVEKDNTVFDSRDNCNAIIETEANRLRAGCKTSTIPYGVEELYNGAFLACRELKSIEIPNTVKIINTQALNSTGITSITLPESLEEIGYAAFAGNELTSITIPANVKVIRDHAFANINGLMSVTSEIELPFEIESGVFSEDTYEKATLYVPSSSIQAYSNTPAWSNFRYVKEIGETTVTAKYENHILTVEGDVSMTQALEQVGGRNVVAKDIAAIVWKSSEAITRSDIEGFGNPNLLIYVQTDSLAPEGVNNVVINGKAKSITLVDAESNNNFYVPMAFTAESISYTREFKQTTEKDVSRGWEGIALPFTVQKFTHESHGEIAPFGNDASIFHFWLHQMTDKGMVNATTIEANKPYIISMPNNGSYPEAYNQAGKVTFSAENVTVPVSDNTAIWTADGTIGMMSTYLRIEPSEYIYALNVGSTMESYAEGSVFVQNLREVKPFEVFTFHEENHHEGAGARFISVSSLFGGEGTTGIIDVMKNAEPNGETWYDLNGRLLQSKPVRKGVYIKNGKKVVVK